MKKYYTGHKLLTIAKCIVDDNHGHKFYSSNKKALTLLGDLPTWIKLSHLNKRISDYIMTTKIPIFLHNNKEYYYSDIVNEKFSTPDELIQFMEDYFLGTELKPKYKVKTFQFLRVNPYVRKAYTVHDKSVWGKHTVKKKPPPKLMPRKGYISSKKIGLYHV